MLNEVLIGGYLIVTVLAMIPTCLEQRASQLNRSWRLAGIAACLLWPLSVTGVAVLALCQGRRNSQQGHSQT